MGDVDDKVEEPLGGGNITGGVVRVGDTVRRPQGRWSPQVHAFLIHLEQVGFDGSPRFLGVDDAGREILTFHEGQTTASVPGLFDGDDRLADVARVVRRLHDASSSYLPLPASPFWEGSVDPQGGTVMLHGDLAPWNVVRGEAGLTIIDWDTISLGRREWELAYVLHTFVPTWPQFGLLDTETVRRFRVVADSYGLTNAELALAVRLIAERCRRVVAFTRERARAGEPAFELMIAEGHDGNWERAASHVDTRLQTWLRLLG